MAMSDYFSVAMRGAVRFRGDWIGAHAQVRQSSTETTGFPSAHADVFRGNILTITSRIDGRIVHEFFPHEWRSATTYAEDGGLERTLVNVGTVGAR